MTYQNELDKALQERRVRRDVERLALEKTVKKLIAEGLSYTTIGKRIGRNPTAVKRISEGKYLWQRKGRD